MTRPAADAARWPPPAAAAARHVVWDWNCTLLDDFAITVEAAAVACAVAGGPQLDADAYRRHFTRPVRRFYESVLDRPVSDDEWRLIADHYHAEYRHRVDTAVLRADAHEALALARDQGMTQSLLSMGEHADVSRAVDRFGLRDFFCLVQGAQVAHRTEAKGALLTWHLAAAGRELGIALRPVDVLLVGDTQDDADAALGAGVRCALLADGCFDRSITARPGITLVESLRAAIWLGPARRR